MIPLLTLNTRVYKLILTIRYLPLTNCLWHHPNHLFLILSIELLTYIFTWIKQHLHIRHHIPLFTSHAITTTTPTTNITIIKHLTPFSTINKTHIIKVILYKLLHLLHLIHPTHPIFNHIISQPLLIISTLHNILPHFILLVVS